MVLTLKAMTEFREAQLGILTLYHAAIFRHPPVRCPSHRRNQNSTEHGAAVYTPFTLKLYDWWVLGVSNRFAWQCPTSTTLLPFFEKHMGQRHLGVGVGTGFYLANARISAATNLTLLDLNDNSHSGASTQSRIVRRAGCRLTTAPANSRARVAAEVKHRSTERTPKDGGAAVPGRSRACVCNRSRCR